MSSERPYHIVKGNLRAIKLVAFVLIILGVNCQSQSNPQLSYSPSLTTQPSESPIITTLAYPTAKITSSPQEMIPPNTNDSLQTTKQTPTISANPPDDSGANTSPFVPIIGDADKIAFIDQNEIWMANLDGNGLTQLTDDGLPKSSLQWSPDTMAVIYLSEACAHYVDIRTLQVSNLACFGGASRLESFQFSPDGDQVAVSLDGQLYVIPYEEVGFSLIISKEDLSEMADCDSLSPYRHRQSMVTVSKARWSSDGDRLAIVRQAYDSDRHVELIQILDISHCTFPLPRLDEFPATRFSMDGYEKNPILQDFAWDGGELFALTSYKRNDGFGDLWIYSTKLHRGFKANPIDGKCCYRDPVFSPDGKYLAFVFQDTGRTINEPAELYYMPYEALDTSLVYPPILFPEDFFTDQRSKPNPILRPGH